MNHLLYRLRRRWKASRPAPTIKPQAFAPGVIEPHTQLKRRQARNHLALWCAAGAVSLAAYFYIQS
jgi:hypothetical protein